MKYHQLNFVATVPEQQLIMHQGARPAPKMLAAETANRTARCARKEILSVLIERASEAKMSRSYASTGL